MKTIVLSLLVSVGLLACHKTETPKPAPTHPVGITPATTSHWQYLYDTCKKMTITADSITIITCVNSVTNPLTHLGGDSVLNGVNPYIIHIVGDTLWYVPYPYKVWDSKYYRL